MIGRLSLGIDEYEFLNFKDLASPSKRRARSSCRRASRTRGAISRHRERDNRDGPAEISLRSLSSRASSACACSFPTIQGDRRNCFKSYANELSGESRMTEQASDGGASDVELLGDCGFAQPFASEVSDLGVRVAAACAVDRGLRVRRP